jgi:hypothetical protein
VSTYFEAGRLTLSMHTVTLTRKSEGADGKQIDFMHNEHLRDDAVLVKLTPGGGSQDPFPCGGYIYVSRARLE